MIVTINKEIKLNGGCVLKSGTKIESVALSQRVKGGALVILSAYPEKQSDVIIGSDDLDKISITPEVLTDEEKVVVDRYIDALEQVKTLGI